MAGKGLDGGREREKEKGKEQRERERTVEKAQKLKKLEFSTSSSFFLFFHTQKTFQRCVNVAFYFGAHAIHAVRVKPLYVALGERHGVRVTTSFLQSAPLVLFNSDFAVEAPRPLPPSALFAGSLMSRPAQPLPKEPWEEFLGPRKEGTVRLREKEIFL